MALTLIVLMLTLLAALVVSALAFWPVEPGPKGESTGGER